MFLYSICMSFLPAFSTARRRPPVLPWCRASSMCMYTLGSSLGKVSKHNQRRRTTYASNRILKTHDLKRLGELHPPSAIVSTSQQAFPQDGANPLRSCSNDLSGPVESPPPHSPRATPNHWRETICNTLSLSGSPAGARTILQITTVSDQRSGLQSDEGLLVAAPPYSMCAKDMQQDYPRHVTSYASVVKSFQAPLSLCIETRRSLAIRQLAGNERLKQLQLRTATSS